MLFLAVITSYLLITIIIALTLIVLMRTIRSHDRRSRRNAQVIAAIARSAESHGGTLREVVGGLSVLYESQSFLRDLGTDAVRKLRLGVQLQHAELQLLRSLLDEDDTPAAKPTPLRPVK